MADNSQREKIEQFTNLTGIDADRAKFYLESSGWNIEVSNIYNYISCYNVLKKSPLYWTVEFTYSFKSSSSETNVGCIFQMIIYMLKWFSFPKRYILNENSC